MQLDRYLVAKNMTDAAFAQLIGVSRSMVTKLRHGDARPSAATALRIEHATDRSVTLSDLLHEASGTSQAIFCVSREHNRNITSTNPEEAPDAL